MAIEYSLDMISNSPPERIADLVRGDAEATLEPLPHGFAIGLPGLYCGVGTVDDRSAEIVEESYGIRPTVSALFRIDSFLPEEGYRTMRDALVRILGAESGDVSSWPITSYRYSGAATVTASRAVAPARG